MDMMNTNFPTPDDRRRLLHSFHDLPAKEKEILYKAVEHLRWLTMLWGLEELGPESTPSILEKRHILLAYKMLHILWFSELPENDNQTFTVYVRDRLPDDQDPHDVNEIFDTNSDELAIRTQTLTRPKSLTKEIKAIQISLDSFPHQVK
jgi:hypothetical protein